MSKLDQPLKVKHGLAAVVAALTLGVAGTAIAGGAGQKDAIRANATTAGSLGGGSLAYRSDSRRVNANSQAYENVHCPAARTFSAAGWKAAQASATRPA